MGGRSTEKGEQIQTSRISGPRREQGLLCGLRREFPATIFGFPDFFLENQVFFVKSISGSPENPGDIHIYIHVAVTSEATDIRKPVSAPCRAV